MDVPNQSLVCQGDCERFVVSKKCWMSHVVLRLSESQMKTLGDVVDVAEGISILPVTSLRGDSSQSHQTLAHSSLSQIYLFPLQVVLSSLMTFEYLAFSFCSNNYTHNK